MPYLYAQLSNQAVENFLNDGERTGNPETHFPFCR